MNDADKLSFEQAFALLEEASQKLRSGKLGLEESIEVYDKSIMYHKRCEEILAEAKQRIMIYDPETGNTEVYDEKC